METNEKYTLSNQKVQVTLEKNTEYEIKRDKNIFALIIIFLDANLRVNNLYVLN